MKKDIKWLRLDNSGKLFPMLRYKDNQNLFRISVELNESVNPELLENCVNTTLERYPSFKVSLKRGAFWYYFERNYRRLFVLPESDIALSLMSNEGNNGYPIRVTYHEKRMNLELYHCVADGSGLIEFVKSLLFVYFAELGYTIDAEGIILNTESEPSESEYEDSFLANYKKMRIRDMTISKMAGASSAYRVSGELFKDEGKGIITGTCKASEIIKIAKSLSCTVTEYLAGLYMYSIYMEKGRLEKDPDNLVLFIPINLRKMYNSVTLRNFTMFSRSIVDIKNPDILLTDFINAVKGSVAADLCFSEQNKNISTAVRAEKFPAMRFMPIAGKKMIFKISNYANTVKPTKTSTISNLGYVKFPESMRPLIARVTFAIRTSDAIPLSMSIISVYDDINISVCRSIKDTKIDRFFFKYLADNGANLTMTSNYWEVENVL